MRERERERERPKERYSGLKKKGLLLQFWLWQLFSFCFGCCCCCCCYLILSDRTVEEKIKIKREHQKKVCDFSLRFVSLLRYLTLRYRSLFFFHPPSNLPFCFSLFTFISSTGFFFFLFSKKFQRKSWFFNFF